MKRTYESVVIFDGTLSDEVVGKEQEKIESFLKENGEYEKTEVWGKRNLMYEIRKRTTGNYYVFIYNAEGSLIDKLHKLLKMNTNIIRHMTVLYEPTPPIPQRSFKPVYANVDENSDLEEGDE